MPINVNLTYRANLANPLTWAQGDANFKTLADNDQFLNSAVEAAALAASQANTNANGRQPSNAKLTAIAASVWAANQMILTTGVDTLSMIPVNTYGLNYLNYANKNEVRNELSINNVDNTADLDKPVSIATQTALNAKISNSQKGVANGVAALGADGKLPVSQLPPLAVNETFVVNSQAEQLALVAERGDMAFRTDQANTPYVLTTDDPAVFANWRTLDKTLSDSLAALNVLTPAADRIPFFTGALTAGLQVLTTVGKALLSAADKLAGRTAIDAAKSGANSDITSLTALTTPLSVSQGGTGKNTAVREVSTCHIEGLTPTWVSGTAISVSPGSAYIESLGIVLQVPNTLSLAGLSLSANAWFHIYLYSNAGTPALEMSATSPAAPFSSKARSKTGDTSRRYLGSMRTSNSSANLMWVTFLQGGKVTYNENGNAAPLTQNLTGLVLGSVFTVNALEFAPLTAHTLDGSIVCTTSNATLWISNGRLGLSTTVFLHALIAPFNTFANIVLDSAPSFSLAYSVGNPNGALIFRMTSYYYER